VVLLCVPDAEIGAAAALIAPGPLVGHCSGATTLAPLAPHEAFSLHPLMTVTADGPGGPGGEGFAGAGAAIAGGTARATALAARLAGTLGMRAVVIADDDRAAYHAAASIASNLLVTLEAAAERIGASAGIDRQLLAPLVRATVENWAALGPRPALTGPVARGDEVTVTRQRAAVMDRAPDLLPLFDVLVDATRTLAGTTQAGPREAGVVEAGVVEADVAEAGVAEAGAAEAGPVGVGAGEPGTVPGGPVEAGAVPGGTVAAAAAEAGAADAGATAERRPGLPCAPWPRCARPYRRRSGPARRSGWSPRWARSTRATCR
jgi:predicted short-subunit dehydrogenase-like oxidoreductase (DUF2520 family)